MAEEYVLGTYDVIVVGAGHAGCEAALACARMGEKTLMLATDREADAGELDALRSAGVEVLLA